MEGSTQRLWGTDQVSFVVDAGVERSVFQVGEEQLKTAQNQVLKSPQEPVLSTCFQHGRSHLVTGRWK